MSKKKLVLVGDSAFAEIAYEYFSRESDFEVVAFAVETQFLKRSSLFGLPVVPFEGIETRFDPKQHFVFVAMVYTQLNRLRSRLAMAAKAKGYSLASFVSPKAFVWPNVEIGEHCFVFEDNTLQAFVRIGGNVIIWSGNHIGHHSVVRDNCFISSHSVVSGFCDIGESSFVGVNSTIANNVKIGRDNWIGPGFVIMKDTPDGSFFKARQSVPAEISTLEFFKVT